MPTDLQTDVLIIGGGLSGLALATDLAKAGVDFQLIEARDRFGGRIKTGMVGEGYFDLGPAWFWPNQPRMAALIKTLGLPVFEQYAQGALTFEDENGRVERGRGFASMQGSLRVRGGLHAVIFGLVDGLPADRLHLNARATAVEGTVASVETPSGEMRIAAQRIALAIPPRLADACIGFEPALDASTRQTMRNVSTWMAGQAKVVAVYDRPFWREAGLSGDAMSRHGPMVEMHDVSPAEGAPYAIFGFVGVPAKAREDRDALIAASVAQLERLFGPEARQPREIFLKDWAFDQQTATTADQAPVYAHPCYGMPSHLAALAERGLYFCGTEVAPTFGGYLEGALEAAGITARALARQNSVSREQMIE